MAHIGAGPSGVPATVLLSLSAVNRRAARDSGTGPVDILLIRLCTRTTDTFDSGLLRAHQGCSVQSTHARNAAHRNALN